MSKSVRGSEASDLQFKIVVDTFIKASKDVRKACTSNGVMRNQNGPTINSTLRKIKAEIDKFPYVFTCIEKYAVVREQQSTGGKKGNIHKQEKKQVGQMSLNLDVPDKIIPLKKLGLTS